LFYFLSGNAGNQQLMSDFRGATVGGISRNILEVVRIPLPPLPIQKKIAAVLEKADELRCKREEQIKQLDDLLQATFLDMFGDPVTNPKGWQKTPLGECTKFENGDRSSNYPSKEDFVESGVLFLMSANIKDRKLDLSETRFIREEKFQTLKNGRLKPFDLVITLRGNGFGKCSIFDCKYKTAFINAQMMIIRPLEMNSTFLHAFLSSNEIYRKIRGMSSGSAQPQLTSNQLTALTVFRPPLDLQNSFAVAIDRIEEQKNHVSVSVEKQSFLFNSLMQRAFKGELDLK